MNFETKYKDTVGRYAVAAIDLKPGNLIFTETSFAFGPKSDSPPLCLGCYVPVDCTKLCSSCKWPVCGRNCETNPVHKNVECAVFTKANVRFQNVIDPTQPCLQYECITPLRVLLSMLRNNDRWNEDVKHMEAHNNERKNRSIWKFNQINIVNYLRGPCRLKIFDEDLIHTVCGILECNAFEARSKYGHSIRCLFPKLAILSHNCVSNIVHTILCNEDGNFEVTVRATTNVNKGEELFSSYTYSLWPTIVRREHLGQSKYFHCSCNRCCDPTELGTHMSSLICTKCNIGVVTENTDSGNWDCPACGYSIAADEVKQLFGKIQKEIDTGGGSQKLEELMNKYTNILHPHNSYLLLLKLSLIPVYKYTNVYKCIQFCKEALHILNVIEPGCTRIRGTTLYELSLATLTLISDLQKKEETEAVAKEMRNSLRFLEECIPILRREPEYTLEGRAAVTALKLLEKIKNNFELIINGRSIDDFV
ncbi:hypothetical protein FQR65_LT10702 [Abscondita terminalis]|nr:hypothetical protein FQR65_LT10702 [Abscondita terminalis]